MATAESPFPLRAEIRPQPRQEDFLSCPADVAIYGGAAGGGKTFALLLEPLYHTRNPSFGAVIFRRTYPEIMETGGPWQESNRIYPHARAESNISGHSWKFPSVATVRFAHLQHEKNIHDWLGSQITLIGFDQLERFTEAQFWYLFSRNRSTCGIKPYIRATANPEPGWLADLLAWWIDQGSGYPIQERAGVLRWFVRHNERLEWFDSPTQAHARFPDRPAKSMTFIPAKLEDNPILMREDPGYLANLMALPHVEQLRLLGGNWKISSAQGEWPPSYFEGPGFWFEDWPSDDQFKIKTMMLDPSKGADAKLGDYQALVFYARDLHGTEWIDADLAKRPMTAAEAPDGTRFTEGMVEFCTDAAKQFRPHGFGLETNQFQLLLKNPFLAEAKRIGYDLPLYEINNRDPKLLRIRRLGPPLSQRKMRFRNTPGGRLLVSQLRSFPDPNYNDDAPDALEGARRLAIELFNGAS